MQHGRRIPKTDFLQIRVTPDDKRRMDEAAGSVHLDTSTWARQVLLKAVEQTSGRSDTDDRG
jgi:predicted transcriptional regulator